MTKAISSESMAPEKLISQQVADALQGRDPSRFKRLRDVTQMQIDSTIKGADDDAYMRGLSNGLILALSIIDNTGPPKLIDEFNN